MHPYVQIGPIRIATYGMLLVAAFITVVVVLRRDLRTRGLPIDPYVIIGVTGVAGLVGAKVWHCLETPKVLFGYPLLIFYPGGFAFFGALISGAIALMLLARHNRLPLLLILDVAAPVAALGYAFGRVGCLLSGDGDYGIPTRLPWGMAFPHGLVPTTQHVHPTPVYEAIVAILIFWILWKLRRLAVLGQIPNGQVFAVYLVLSGSARFLVEFIRINPQVIWGMSNAQIASLASVFTGCLLYMLGAARDTRAESG